MPRVFRRTIFRFFGQVGFHFQAFRLRGLRYNDLPMDVTFVSMGVGFRRPSFLLHGNQFRPNVSRATVPCAVRGSTANVSAML